MRQWTNVQIGPRAGRFVANLGEAAVNQRVLTVGGGENGDGWRMAREKHLPVAKAANFLARRIDMATLPPAELVVTIDSDRDKSRTAALDQFIAMAKASSFRSTSPYPSREELHERDGTNTKRFQ